MRTLGLRISVYPFQQFKRLNFDDHFYPAVFKAIFFLNVQILEVSILK
jgi:hypothetical protein